MIVTIWGTQQTSQSIPLLSIPGFADISAAVTAATNAATLATQKAGEAQNIAGSLGDLAGAVVAVNTARTEAQTAAGQAAAAAASVAGMQDDLTAALGGLAEVDRDGILFFDLARALNGTGNIDVTDDFVAILNAAQAAGVRKIISTNPAHRYKIVEAEMPGSFDIDLNGAAFVADFDNLYPGTCATILKTSNEANGFNVAIRNAVIDGQNTGNNPSGSGGNPLLDFRGGRIELDRVTVKRGANRDGSPITTYADVRQGEVQCHNCEVVWIHDSRITGSPGEQVHIVSTAASTWARTVVQIERTYFDKAREDSPGNNWSSSSVVVYGCGKGSYLKDCRFGQHVKSAVNWFGPGLIEGNRFRGVSDSQAIDCDEAGSFGMDGLTIRGNFIQNVTGGYAIRVSGRQVLIEGNEINRCQNGIYVEAQVATPSTFLGLGSDVPRRLYNVILRNNYGNGNDVVDGSGNPVASNTFIRIKGADATLLATVLIEGTGVHNHATGTNYPSANSEYGIDAENCDLTVRGAFAHGALSKVRMTGHKRFKAVDALFFVRNAETLLTLDGGTVEDVIFEDCRVVASTWTGKHVALASAPVWSGRLHRIRSAGITVIDPGIPYTTDYTTTGTSA